MQFSSIKSTDCNAILSFLIQDDAVHRSVTNVLRYLKPPAIASVRWYQFRINLKHVNSKENIVEMSLLGQRKINFDVPMQFKYFSRGNTF